MPLSTSTTGYYHANREEIEHDLAADEALYEKLVADHASRAS